MTNLAQLTDKTENFKYVIVAAGHFSYPNIPYISGIQKFKGRIVHSHDVRTFDEFKDKIILVIGGARSGEDLVGQCFKYNSKKIVWTYRSLKEIYNP